MNFAVSQSLQHQVLVLAILGTCFVEIHVTYGNWPLMRKTLVEATEGRYLGILRKKYPFRVCEAQGDYASLSPSIVSYYNRFAG